MKRMWSAVVVCVLAGLLAGCVNMTVRKHTDQEFAPVSKDQVVVYQNEKDVPGNYEKIALIHAQSKRVNEDVNRVIEMVREKAGKLGANGIILGRAFAPKVSSTFKRTAGQQTPGNQRSTGGRVAMDNNMDPLRQDAWGQVEAIYVVREAEQ